MLILSMSSASRLTRHQAQQFLGINMLVYFSTQIFTNLNFSPLLSGILAGVLNTAFAIASYPPIWYIERVGRRAMMIW